MWTGRGLPVSEQDGLQRSHQDELGKLADPLLGFAREQVAKRGGFLPFGASLTTAGQVVFQAASNGAEVASSLEVLPLLHEAMRLGSQKEPVAAVAVCEWVKISTERGTTDAIKVLLEHVSGFAVAFYVPCTKRLLRGWSFGEVFYVSAKPEVQPWGNDAT
jgi:hypothetical protein